MADPLTSSYAALLEGAYDCTDRIVLNACFGPACSPGGFRSWWRLWQGSDQDLDDTHLIRLAGRFSRRVRAFANQASIPLLDCRSGQRKNDIATAYRPTDPNFQGLFLICVSRAPAPVWSVKRNAAGLIQNITRPEKLPFVNHYSFHILDPEWGHLTFKLCGHPPWSAQIMLNGHEFAARLARARGRAFTKEGNCFTSGLADLADCADAWRAPHAIGRLTQVCERWIYSSCLCFALDRADQERTRFRYDFYSYQLEYSRNLLFSSGRILERTFQALIDRTRRPLGLQTVKTIFGYKHRPFRRKTNAQPRLECVIERPAYDLTVLKLHFDKRTLKIYTKGERVLRFEVILHNARILHRSRRLEHLPDFIAEMRLWLERFMLAVHALEAAFIDETTLEDLPTPSQVGRSRVGGLNLHKPRQRAVLEALLALGVQPGGFSASQLAARVRAILRLPDPAYTPRQAAYDLKKLRGKQMLERHTARSYQIQPAYYRVLAALHILQEKVVRPLLANLGQCSKAPRPKPYNPIDEQYRKLRKDMQILFQHLGLVA